MRTKLLAAAVSLLSLASVSRANMLNNGPLDLNSSLSCVQPDNLFYASWNHYSQALPGWTITGQTYGGSIDVIPTSYFATTDGGYCVDLIGTPDKVGGGYGLGGIQQAVTTVAGTTYTLTFDLSANPEGNTLENLLPKNLRVEILRPDTSVLKSQDFTINVGTRTKTDMQWLTEALTFTADTTQATVRLTALNALGGTTGSIFYCGPVVDNVNLLATGDIPAPEPASLALLGIGAAGLLARRRR